VINKKIKILILIFCFNFLLVNNILGNEKDYFLTLKYNQVKVRQGPSFEYPVKFIYKKNHKIKATIASIIIKIRTPIK